MLRLPPVMPIPLLPLGFPQAPAEEQARWILAANLSASLRAAQAGLAEKAIDYWERLERLAKVCCRLSHRRARAFSRSASTSKTLKSGGTSGITSKCSDGSPYGLADGTGP